MDERSVKRPLTLFGLFVSQRWASGDLAGLKVGEATKLASSEYKKLSASELQVSSHCKILTVDTY